MSSTASQENRLPYRWLMFSVLAIMSGLSLWGFGCEYLEGKRGADQEGRSKGIVEDLMEEFGYGFGDVLLVVEGDDLFKSESVAATRSLVAELESTLGVGEVFSLDRVPKEANILNLRSVLPPNGSPDLAYEEAREQALAHPLIPGLLSNQAGDLWILPIGLDLVAWVEYPESDFPKLFQAAIDQVQLPQDMHVSLTGAVMLTSASAETFEHEQWLYHSIAYVLVFLLATFIFRGPWPVLLSGGGPVLGVFWTFGIAKLLGLYMSSLTLILLPVMLLMIGFTDSVHLMVHLRKERGKGRSPAQATAAAVRLLYLPCLLTSLTTGLGFASLLTARSELVQDFGAACALGVLCTLLAVLTFLPFFASSFIGKYIRERESSRFVEGAMPFADGIIRWTLRHARLVTLAGCLAALGTGLYGGDIETDNRVRADIPKSSEAARALRLIDQGFGGSIPVNITVQWEESLDDDWTSILAAVGAAHDIVRVPGEHSRPTSMLDALSFIGAGKSPAEAMSFFGLLPAALRQHVLDKEARAAYVMFQLPDLGYRHFEPAFATWEEQLSKLEPAHPGVHFSLGGQAIQSGKIYAEFTTDLMNSLALAGVIIFGVLTAAFRSLRLGLISIVPNVLPLTGTAAILVAMDMPMAGATALVMSLGIAVDDTIHFLTRFRHEFTIDGDRDAAIRRATLGVGKALMMTTVVLVVGFASVMTSDFPRNRVFSGMICLSLVLALLSDLVLLPAMLRLVVPPKGPTSASPNQ